MQESQNLPLQQIVEQKSLNKSEIIETYIREDGRYVVREYFQEKPELPNITTCTYITKASLKLFSVLNNLPIDDPVLTKKEKQELSKLPLYMRCNEKDKLKVFDVFNDLENLVTYKKKLTERLQQKREVQKDQINSPALEEDVPNKMLIIGNKAVIEGKVIELKEEHHTNKKSCAKICTLF